MASCSRKVLLSSMESTASERGIAESEIRTYSHDKATLEAAIMVYVVASTQTDGVLGDAGPPGCVRTTAPVLRASSARIFAATVYRTLGTTVVTR
jgi:hypothetical protein